MAKNGPPELNDFKEIIPKEYLKENDGTIKDSGTVKSKSKEDSGTVKSNSKLKKATIVGIKNPFQIIIDNGKDPFTQFLKHNGYNIQKVCDSILLYEKNNGELQPVFVELKSGHFKNEEIMYKMQCTEAIFRYYMAILELRFGIKPNKWNPISILLYQSRERKRSKGRMGEKRGKFYFFSVNHNEEKISLSTIMNVS